MTTVSILAPLRVILHATDWLDAGRELQGFAVRCVAMAKRLRIILSTGITITWPMSQRRCDQLASMFNALVNV